MDLFENFDRKEFEVDVLGIRKGVVLQRTISGCFQRGRRLHDGRRHASMCWERSRLAALLTPLQRSVINALPASILLLVLAA
jgi:hypothetical protein